MRTFSLLRALTMAAVLSAPLAQVAFADQQDQQALTPPGNAPGTSFLDGGPYTAPQPSVGD